MDELEQVQLLCPERPVPTNEERENARQSLMQVIEASQSGGRGKTGFNRRRWPVLAAAAAVALVAMVGALMASDTGSGPLATPHAAAAQLHELADLAAENPYPAYPYAQVVRAEVSAMDMWGNEHDPKLTEITTYALGDGNTVLDLGSYDVGSCSTTLSDGMPPVPCSASVPEIVPAESPNVMTAEIMAAGSAAEVRAALNTIIARIELDDANRLAASLGLATTILRSPRTSAVVRAELLHFIADHAEITATPEVTTSLGDVGTLFSIETDGANFEVVIDPTNGLILEANPPWVSYGQPHQLAELPGPIAEAKTVLDAWNAMNEGGSGGSCAGVSPNDVTGEEPRPELENLVILHCS